MTFYGVLYYLLAIVTVASTLLAVIARHPVYSVMCLVCSFLSTALIFYLLGAPLLAAFEVIIYAGAIMVLFLFVIMTLSRETMADRQPFPGLLPYTAIAGVLFLAAVYLLYHARDAGTILAAAYAGPRQFGQFLFRAYWLPVEIVSILLLAALAGALHLGRRRGSIHTASPGRDA